MSTYLVFAGKDYYPTGGIDDLVGLTNDFAAAVQMAEDRGLTLDDWQQIVLLGEDQHIERHVEWDQHGSATWDPWSVEG